jgi:hypothetical protein
VKKLKFFSHVQRIMGTLKFQRFSKSNLRSSGRFI